MHTMRSIVGNFSELIFWDGRPLFQHICLDAKEILSEIKSGGCGLCDLMVAYVAYFR